MEWWDDLVAWASTDAGWRILSSTLIPVVAILVAGLVGAGTARSSIQRLLAQRDREQRVAAVTALVTAGQHAAKWGSLSTGAREHAEELASRADIEVRLLPARGSEMAADWAAHQIATMRTESVSYSFQAEESIGEYVDRLADWLHHPRRAKKLFGADLEAWRYLAAESSTPSASSTSSSWQGGITPSAAD